MKKRFRKSIHLKTNHAYVIKLSLGKKTGYAQRRSRGVEAVLCTGTFLEENEIIKNNLGLYSLSPENQYHEVFAETFTKIICNCLSPQDSLPVKNPLEEMKSLPCEFLRILAKLF